MMTPTEKQRYGIALLLSAVMLFFGAYPLLKNILISDQGTYLELEIQSMTDAEIQVFYDKGAHFNLPHSSSRPLNASQEYALLRFDIAADSILTALRIDLGSKPAQYRIRRIGLHAGYGKKDWTAQDFMQAFRPENDIAHFGITHSDLVIATNGEDPYFTTVENIQSIYSGLHQAKPNTWKPVAITLVLVFLLIVGGAFTPLYRRAARLPLAQTFLMVGFLAMISAPLFYMFTGSGVSETSGEFRKRAPRPVFAWKDWSRYPAAYTAYFNDHFGLREAMIKGYSRYRFCLYHDSPVPDKVLVGRNNWLYSTEDGAIEDYRGMTPFTGEELHTIKANLEKRQTFLSQRNIRYYLLIAPNKTSIYPEYMPRRINRYSTTDRWEQLRQYLADSCSVPVLDMEPVLLQAKQHQPLYFKTDLHWNNHGAFLAYTQLMQRIHADFPSLRPLSRENFTVLARPKTDGDMARMIGIEHIPDTEYIYQSLKPTPFAYLPPPVYPTYISPEAAIVTAVNDTLLPRALVFRDSYTSYMIPFLSPHFHRCVYLWTHSFDYVIVEQEKPDIVVHELAEKLIYKLLTE